MLQRLLAISLFSFAMSMSAGFAANVSVSTLTAIVDGTRIPVYLYKPPGPGPFPLVILSHGSISLNHGSPLSVSDPSLFGPGTMRSQALLFVDDGAAVAVPIRRGYGGNGKYVEGVNRDCSGPGYHDAGLTGADDIGAALRAVIEDPAIDRSRVVLVGLSAGGFASIAAGTREKVLGVVSFAGGLGSIGRDEVSCENQLISAMKRYGAASHVPELWIYSENDHYFPPPIALKLHDAFVTAGGDATLVMARQWSDEGHTYIDYPLSWKVWVDAFLRQIRFFR